MITLELIPLQDLHDLARSTVPARLVGIARDGALPPAFVAIRSLDQIGSGKPEAWCRTFYIRFPDHGIVGGCGFKDAPHDGQVEIGYAIAPDCRNRGFATAALRSLVDIAFGSSDVTTVLAQVSQANIASSRVVDKLGFATAGIRTDQDNDVLVQWILRRPRPDSADRT
jgi:ribosomal-protein-alanine N-acetyltransferase